MHKSGEIQTEEKTSNPMSIHAQIFSCRNLFYSQFSTGQFFDIAPHEYACRRRSRTCRQHSNGARDWRAAFKMAVAWWTRCWTRHCETWARCRCRRHVTWNGRRRWRAQSSTSLSSRSFSRKTRMFTANCRSVNRSSQRNSSSTERYDANITEPSSPHCEGLTGFGVHASGLFRGGGGEGGRPPSYWLIIF